jgi:HEAT repeat protein
MTDWKRPRPGNAPLKPIPNIWLLQSKGDVDSLMSALTHPDPGTRRGAAAALRALGAWHAVPALQAALAGESDWQAHAAISAAIQYLDRDIHVEGLVNARDVRGLCKMLNSNRHEEIIIACEALASLADRSAVEPLIMVFRNTLWPSKVRLAAAEALLKLEGAPAVVTLLRALRSEDWRIRQNAAMILGQVNATWATAPLGKALEDSQPEVVKTALESLRRFNTPDAMEIVNLFIGRVRKTATKEMPQTPKG